MYATSSHEQNGNIITFAQFEEGDLLENKHIAEEDKSILDSIDGLSTDNDSEEGSISTDALGDIWDGSQIHPKINTRYDKFKIRDLIRQTQAEWKVVELSENSMVKGLHKIFKADVN